MKWIKCSEAMPEMGQEVLIYYNVKELKFIGFSWLVENSRYKKDNEIWFRDSDCCDRTYYEREEITHWMKLPEEPYEGR